MDRMAGYGSVQANSYSVTSLADGSEPISEAEEINEVRFLQEKGDKALKLRGYTEALQFYSEALEIDDRNTQVLEARAMTYVKLRNYPLALKDTEILIALCPDHSQAHFLHGVALKYVRRSKEALAEFLTALDLDPDRADYLTNHIAATAASFCDITPEVMESLKEMDAYKKMSEVGVCLFAAKKYSLCVRVLDAAQKLRTNQKGITVRVLLTLANAHSALKHEDQSIGLYQECLAIASSIHDQLYQTKALVNIATLNSILGDYHQAIVHYEKMIDLEAELREEAGAEQGLPEFWTTELRCGLHLNLSVAYKTIGNMTEALTHAQRYVSLLEDMGSTGKQRAESYYNIGMLNIILRNFQAAAKNYQMFLEESEKIGNRKGVAQAFGCLGTVHASLSNWDQALEYHQQDIAIATKMADTRMVTMAHEMLGDSLMMKKDYNAAVLSYDDMLSCCRGNDSWLEAMAYCKTGNAYKALGKHQYALHFYEKAMSQFSGPKFKLVEMMCMYNMALILVNSTQLDDMEQAIGYLRVLIPQIEETIQQHLDEGSHCESSYHSQLFECYTAMQAVLVKLGRKDTALQYAEAFRRRTLIQMENFHLRSSSKQLHAKNVLEMSSLSKLLPILSQQNATVLFYSLLPRQLLLWVLAPSGELVRFYSSKVSEEANLVEKIQELMSELMTGLNDKEMMTGCENRTLPRKNQGSERALHAKQRHKDGKDETESGIEKNAMTDQHSSDTELSAQRELYNFLLAPVEDVLSGLPSGSPIVIVPGRALSSCPFHCLEDWSGASLGGKFGLTCLPNIVSLDIVMKNEQELLKAQDELNFERVQSRCGSMNKHLTQFVLDNCMTSESSPDYDELPPINPKQVSNPSLLREDLRSPNNNNSRAAMPTPVPMVSFTHSGSAHRHSPGEGRKSSSPLNPLPEVKQTVSLKSLKPLGSPPTLTKLLHHDTISTLTPWTSTGTDISRSNRFVPEFAQISDQERCVVIGYPTLPKSLTLYRKSWQPGEDLLFAKHETKFVSSYLDVEGITGRDATKQRFLQEISTATILHIATYGCLEEGTLVMSPNDLAELNPGPPHEALYLVTPGDLLNAGMQCQLVVLSCGWGPYHLGSREADYKLATAFLAAGTQCVLQTLWALPNDAMEKFYFHFYQSLQAGSMLSAAVMSATKALQADSRFSAPFFWCPFVLIGKDVFVNVKSIRHAMLDQKIDETEELVQDMCEVQLLNPKPLPALAETKEESLTRLQLYLSKLLHDNHKQPQTIHSLIDLLDESLKRLHTADNNNKTTQVRSELTDSHGAMDLLHFLGFHFQAKGPYVENPYVVYPHWNREDLLVPTYDALKALTEIVKKVGCVQALCELLPLSQEVLSHLIDLLSITKHAGEIQLKVSDLSVRPLWQKSKVKALLLAIGFHQIGMLLGFSNIPENRRVLTAVLQLLLTVSCHKSQVLLYRLDVSLLGRSPPQKSMVGRESGKLPSLNPVVVNKKLHLSTPWMSVIEKPEEMGEKIKLAKSKRRRDRSYEHQLEKARSWHQVTVSAQGNMALEEIGRPKTSPSKVKVKAGAGLSQDRVPVGQAPRLSIPQTAQRREYAHFILERRLEEVSGQNQVQVRNLYLPYVQAV